MNTDAPISRDVSLQRLSCHKVAVEIRLLDSTADQSLTASRSPLSDFTAKKDRHVETGLLKYQTVILTSSHGALSLSVK